MVAAERLLQRFLRYVQIDTTACDSAGRYPSCDGQFVLGALLADELRAIGLTDVRQDEHGLVWATLAANGRHEAPVIALNAHLDTSPETTGANVCPQVIRNYGGGDIPLPGDAAKVITVRNNPELEQLRGRTLVTSDGTTLLGGDDKAGIAAIVEAAACLAEHPEWLHGPVRLLFTCDEEIGRGVEHVDIAALGAVAAYTLDGPGADKIDVETFSADLATMTFRGVNIHPSIAKDRMVNAVRAAADFVSRLPVDTLSPERTDGRDGFLHPYTVDGGVGEVHIKILLRDFEASRLEEQAALLRRLASETESRFPGAVVQVETRAQYRNMREGLESEPRAVRLAELALRKLGREPQRTIIRGGTDGSQLTARGLPTPNLSTGQHNPHSPLEWVCLEEMVQASQMLVELVKLWGDPADAGACMP